MQAVVCHGPRRLPARRGPRARRRARARRCVRVEAVGHLRQRPEVLPRRREVLGRREPARLGRDRRRSPATSSPAHRRARRRGRRTLGRRRRRPRRRRADRARAGTAATATAATTTCASRTTCTASSAAPRAPWPSTWSIPTEALVHKAPTTSRRRTSRSPNRCPARCTPSNAPSIRFDDTVVVAGCGPIGLGMIAGAAAKFPPAHHRPRRAAAEAGTGQEVRGRHHLEHHRGRRRRGGQEAHRTGTAPTSTSRARATRRRSRRA